MIRCDAYLEFIGRNPLQQIMLLDEMTWKYFDTGPKLNSQGNTIEPLICIHGTSGTAHAFFMQLSELSIKGYRVLSVGYPSTWTHDEWVKSFARFLDHMRIDKAHLYGVSLGGFLAQAFTRAFPRRVCSLVLTHSLCDTSSFQRNSTLYEGLYAYMPSVYLRELILESFPSEPIMDESIRNAVDFQMSMLDTLDQSELASRITLNVQAGLSNSICRPGALRLEDSKITFIDAMDQVSISKRLREQLYDIYPDAKHADIKSGGDFVYISRYEEVNLHLVVHLHRNGLEILDLEK